MSYKASCEVSHLPKTGNYVITWRGVKFFNKVTHVYQKSAFEIVQFLQSIQDIQRYIYVTEDVGDWKMLARGICMTFL